MFHNIKMQCPDCHVSAKLENQNRIDDYALSMFRFETLHPAWIKRCANYLSHIFSDAIKNAIVVDYAFGRGNWSLAFLEAGAKRIVAIDAAESNASRFSDYLKSQDIGGVNVITGNVLERPIRVKADILWIYGILPCIENPEVFMSLMTGMWAENGKGGGLGLLYAYNSASLREVIVSLVRQALAYRSYEAFLDESFLFNPPARMRMRDDLTAPHVLWHTRSDLVRLVTGAGGDPSRFVPSFGRFDGTENQEFRPHHLMFRQRGDQSALKLRTGDENELPIDENIIHSFGGAVLDSVSGVQARKIAVGLANTHFSALAYGGYERALSEDFLFLLYAFKALDLSAGSPLQEELLLYAADALQGHKGRKPSSAVKGSKIAEWLSSNAIRI